MMRYKSIGRHRRLHLRKLLLREKTTKLGIALVVLVIVIIIKMVMKRDGTKMKEFSGKFQRGGGSKAV